MMKIVEMEKRFEEARQRIEIEETLKGGIR